MRQPWNVGDAIEQKDATVRCSPSKTRKLSRIFNSDEGRSGCPLQPKRSLLYRSRIGIAIRSDMRDVRLVADSVDELLFYAVANAPERGKEA